MSAGTSYAKRWAGGFVDLPTQTTYADSTFLNAVETALLQLLGQAPSADGQVAQWDNANTRFGPALILNKNVDPSAAIASSKIDFTGGNALTNAAIAGAAAIARSKLDFGSGLVNADISATAALVASKMLPVRTGTTIGGLGTAADGALGRLRLGGTPYEFLDVVYDATYGKWVSPEYAIWSIASPSGANSPTTFSWAPGGATTLWPGAAVTRFKNYTDAGLTPQLRMMGVAQRITTQFQMSVDLWHQTADNATADSTRFQLQYGSFQLASPGAGAIYGFDSGWANITLPGTPKDIMVLNPRFDSSGAGTLQVGTSIHLRWVA